jgi:hypothetical protein
MVLMGVMPAHTPCLLETASHARVIQQELQTCLPGALQMGWYLATVSRSALAANVQCLDQALRQALPKSRCKRCRPHARSWCPAVGEEPSPIPPAMSSAGPECACGVKSPPMPRHCRMPPWPKLLCSQAEMRPTLFTVMLKASDAVCSLGCEEMVQVLFRTLLSLEGSCITSNAQARQHASLLTAASCGQHDIYCFCAVLHDPQMGVSVSSTPCISGCNPLANAACLSLPYLNVKGGILPWSILHRCWLASLSARDAKMEGLDALSCF